MQHDKMSESFQHSLTYQQLLHDLKNTVEGLLGTQVANVWFIYGGLNRLHYSVEKLFTHGCIDCEENPGYFNFIQGLDWLQPETSKSYFTIDCEYKPHLPPHLKDDKASTWLYRSLENHSLSQKLSWLLTDKAHLAKCYESHAFLCQEQYAEATLICLRAVERNRASLLSEINPCLFLLQSNATGKESSHRRCSSFPDNRFKAFLSDEAIRNKRRKSMIHDLMSTTTTLEENRQAITATTKSFQTGKLKPWHSMPNLLTNNMRTNQHEFLNINKTMPSTPVHAKKMSDKISPSALKVDYNLLKKTCGKKSSVKKCVSRKKEMRHVIINNYDIIEHAPPCSSSQSSGGNDLISEMPKYNFLPLSGTKDYKRNPKKTFIEDGGISVLPMATGYFPKPSKGQSLFSFLTSPQFARANAELDRENAHFHISEAIISAMEQLKCKRNVKLTDDEQLLDLDSDPEIIDLKQRIRLRRRQKFVEKQRNVLAESLLSDGKTDTATSASPYSTPPETPSTNSGTSSDDQFDDLDVSDDVSILEDQHGLSMSMASLYSEADIMKRSRGAPDGASDIFSAEGVALSLISKFSEKQLPRASELQWLVSEEDAPQALLPLPKSWPVNPDDSDVTLTPSLRGTQEWAPPRAQIIFTYHKGLSRKVLMDKQNYRCAGCSMKVEPKYSSKFRYCDYLGRYFCTGCHKNQVALIPGRILQKWDFTRYPVSTFSYRLLEQMYTDPLFKVFELNKYIGKKSRNLEFCRHYRLGLSYFKDFIYTCRLAEGIQDRFEQEKPYILSDPEIYSIEDLVNVRSGEMKSRLKYLVELCCRHTSECKLCLAKGFICEICHLDEVIFPWQMRKVKRCSKCGACYHATCWNPSENFCKKCDRICKRRDNIASTSKN